MLNEPTIEKLRALRLGVMADAWIAQSKDSKVSSLSFDERFGLLAILDRLVNSAYKIDLKGHSRRKSKTTNDN